MKSFITTFPFITLLFIVQLQATPATMQPGEYLAESGAGTLLVTNRKKGQYFKINSYGANGHSCFVDGIAENNVSTLNVDFGEHTTCTITFTPKGDMIQVQGGLDGSCAAFCGARANFSLSYFKSDAICENKNKHKNLKLFKTYYSKKNYDLAEKTLRRVYDSCKKYMPYFEQFEIINDLAVTYKNLKRKDDCLALIKPFDENADMTEQQVREGYPPADADNFIPLFKKLKFNRDLCRNLK